MKAAKPATLTDIDSLAGLREELRLQAHLLKAEVQDRWHDAEARWAAIQEEARSIRTAVDHSRAELSSAASLSAQSLRETYEDLRKVLRSL